MKYDVVYVLKDFWLNEELKYSIRSLANLKCIRKVWVYGPKLDWFSDNIICIDTGEQNGNKWGNVNDTLRRICLNSEITKDFILMNDDFFIMKEMSDIPTFTNRTLDDRIEEIKNTSNLIGFSRYMKGLQLASLFLEGMGCGTKNYELHMPMKFNRKNLYRILQFCGDSCARRSLYGNIYRIDSVETRDCKVYSLGKKIPDTDFLSGTDEVFYYGTLGDYIRRKFREKSIYER